MMLQATPRMSKENGGRRGGIMAKKWGPNTKNLGLGENEHMEIGEHMTRKVNNNETNKKIVHDELCNLANKYEKLPNGLLSRNIYLQSNAFYCKNPICQWKCCLVCFWWHAYWNCYVNLRNRYTKKLIYSARIQIKKCYNYKKIS